MTFCSGGNTFCCEKKKNWKKFEQKFEQKIWKKNLGVLIYVKLNLVLSYFCWLWWGGREEVWGHKIKVDQNGLKYILVLKFLKSNDFF